MIGSPWPRASLVRKLRPVSRRHRRCTLMLESLEDRWLLDSTTTSIAPSPSSVAFGQSIQITGTVTPLQSTVDSLTGSIVFADGSTQLATVPLGNDGVAGEAQLTMSAFTAGTHMLTATYSGDANHTGSTSSAVSVTVSPDSTITGLKTLGSSFAFGQPIVLSGAVAPANSSVNTVTGSLAFYDGSTLLGTFPVGVEGVVASATFTAPDLSPGMHTLTAVYSGDADHAGSTSPAVVVTVAMSAGSSGVISGTVFQDFNTNGVQDPGEPGLAGQTVFLDLDGSGVLEASDPTATTDANGNYQFTGLGAGTYTVRQVLYGGVLGSAPANGSDPVTLADGATVTGQNFADVLTSIAVPLTLTPSTPFPKQGNANADFVEAVYRSLLNRDADAGGLASWTSLLNSGAQSRLQVVQGIRNSPEHFTQEVEQFYLTLLDRPADASGLQNWVQQLESGMSEEQVTFAFLDSPEYLSKGDKNFVDAMYQSLLGRTFDTAGEANWLTELGDDTSGNSTGAASLTHQQVITDFLYSVESETRLTEGYYAVYLQRPADAAGLSGWVSQLQQGTPFLTIGQQFLASEEFYDRAAQQG
jgi:hypothetical protein